MALQGPSNHDCPPGIFRLFPCSSFPPTTHLCFSHMALAVPPTAVWAHSSVPVIMRLPLPGRSSSHSLPLRFFLFLKIQRMSRPFRTSLDFCTVLSSLELPWRPLYASIMMRLAYCKFLKNVFPPPSPDEEIFKYPNTVSACTRLPINVERMRVSK